MASLLGHLHYSTEFVEGFQGIHWISGSSSRLMRTVRLFPAALLFPALLCVIPAARAQETPATQNQGIHVSVDRVNVA